MTPGGILSDEPYYDISNVEVLRGPQGTFAGENATGGAIFITETDPQLNQFGGWVEGQYGNYNDARLQGAINIPIGDTFALRIATDDERRDSFFHVTGPFTGSDGQLFLGAGRVSALWQPTKAFKAVLKLDYMDEDMSHPSGVFNGDTSTLFNVTQAGHLLGIERQFRAVLQLSYEFDDGITIKSISGYQIGKVAATIDANGAASTASEITYHANSADQTESEEVDVISPSTGRFQWVFGGVYQSDVVSQPNAENWLSLTPGSTPSSIPTPASCPIFFLTAGTVPCETVLLDEYTATKDSAGVFGQASFAITPDLKLEVGARYSSLSFRLDSLDELLLFNTPALGQRIVGDTENDSKVTGKVDLEWNVDRNNMLYGFVATGHKGGGVNGLGTLLPIIPGIPLPPATAAQLPAQFGPENVTDYEIGWKATAFDNHLHTQLGAFYNDYTGFQVAFFVPTLAAGIDVNAPGHTIIDGVEAQAQSQWGGWGLDFGASYVHSSLGAITAIELAQPARRTGEPRRQATDLRAAVDRPGRPAVRVQSAGQLNPDAAARLRLCGRTMGDAVRGRARRLSGAAQSLQRPAHLPAAGQLARHPLCDEPVQRALRGRAGPGQPRRSRSAQAIRRARPEVILAAASGVWRTRLR